MLGRNAIPDKDLLKTVNTRLMRAGGSQARIVATTLQGMVTLSGNLQYAIQRSPIVKSIANVAGVRRVVDLMQLVEKNRT